MFLKASLYQSSSTSGLIKGFSSARTLCLTILGPRYPALFTNDYIKKPVSPNSWVLRNKKVPFIQILLAELGNKATLDRLTIFKARPNYKKGNVCSLLSFFFCYYLIRIIPNAAIGV